MLASNRKFDKLMSGFRSNPGCGGLDLASFLILPVQRIPRYELLLKELQKNSTEKDPQLEEVVQNIQTLTQKVNESRRLVDNILKVRNTVYTPPLDLRVVSGC